MVRLPSSQPVPRVPRSRRDARFVMSHPLPPKRGGVGIVTSREGDTCSVLITGEIVSGCIPLTSMPPVDAIVEVEARGDIMVILDWTAGEPAQPQLGGWYLDPVESPGWVEDDSDSDVGMGERVSNPAPEGPGLLWNTTEFRVRPGDELDFSMLVSGMDLPAAATVQLVVCFVEYGVDPQPANGEVISYGSSLRVDDLVEEFATTADVPDTFTKPDSSTATPGHARLGLRIEQATPPAPDWQAMLTGPTFGIGGDTFATAVEIPPAANAASGNVSNVGFTMESGEPQPQALMARSMWWSYTPDVSGLLRIAWFGDTVLSLYTGTSLSDLVDQQSMFGTSGAMYQEVDAGTTYWLQLASYGDYDHSQLLQIWAPVPYTKIEVPVDEVTQLGPGGGSPPQSLGEIIGGSGALSTVDDATYLHQYGMSDVDGPGAVGASFTVHFPATPVPTLPLLALYQTWRSKVNDAIVTASGGIGDQQMWPKITCDRPNESTAQRGAYGVPVTEYRWHRHPWAGDIDLADVTDGEITYAGNPYSEIWANSGAPPEHERFVSYLATTVYLYGIDTGGAGVDVLIQAELLTQETP